MKSLNKKMLRRLIIRTYFGFVLLVMVLSYLAGCAADEKIKSASAVQQPPMPKGPTVARLDDGREGFVIMEVSHMDEASRRDFEVAVAMLNDREYDGAIELLEKDREQQRSAR